MLTDGAGAPIETLAGECKPDAIDATTSMAVGMSRLSTVCRFCISDGVPRRSMAVALIVGTVLNLINQGDVLLGAGRVNFLKMILTFAVPYGVATYGAVSYRLNAARAVDDTRPGTVGR